MKKASTFKNITYKVSNQNKYTYQIKAIKEFVEDEIIMSTFVDNNNKLLFILNVFAGKSKYGVTNDLNPDMNTDYKQEALEFLKRWMDETIDIVLFDPPFNLDLHKKYYDNGRVYTNYGKWIWELKKEIARVLKVGGKVIHSGYETNGIGSIKGFEKENLLITAHGGLLRDTLTYTEIKRESGLHNNTWRGNNGNI